MSTELSSDSLVEDFLKQFPELHDDSHLDRANNHDLPYVFFGMVHQILSKAITEDTLLAEKITEWLDSAFANNKGNESARDLLWVSFLEATEHKPMHREFLLSHLTSEGNLQYRRYLYLMDNGGLNDPNTGEILNFSNGNESGKTGKFLSDIK
ncbi:MAG: hypothetical protein JWM39_114 [Parcubacteria group bacterium]|nr:hypothetical protein [Parcubacteria group bacterium]